ncbi:hypothetical protein [Paraburkholderia tropica]|uniref:hypothetical protein n=1 Tax=Paraburkholderia tropica TaxID=92647 RepID=UPI003D288B58
MRQIAPLRATLRTQAPFNETRLKTGSKRNSENHPDHFISASLLIYRCDMLCHFHSRFAIEPFTLCAATMVDAFNLFLYTRFVLITKRNISCDSRCNVVQVSRSQPARTIKGTSGSSGTQIATALLPLQVRTAPMSGTHNAQPD